MNTIPHVVGLYEGSIRFTDRNHLVLPMLGTIRMKGSRKLIDALLNRAAETRIGTVTIRMDACGDCYISLALASDEPFHTAYVRTGRAAGMDESPRYLKQAEKKLRKAQRVLSRKYKAARRDGRDYRVCRNYQEARLRLAKCHRHVANQRLDFIRCTADKEVKSHDYLFAEDLKVRNLKKNHKLAKAISDSGWRTRYAAVSCQTTAESYWDRKNGYARYAAHTMYAIITPQSILKMPALPYCKNPALR